MGKWQLVKIKDLGNVIGGGTPSTNNNEFWNGEIFWITPKDLSNHAEVFIKRGARNISKQGLSHSSAKLVPEGTVLFSSRAPIGYVAIASCSLTTNQGFKSVVPDVEKISSKYLYYTMVKNAEMIKYRFDASTFAEISGGDMKNLELLVTLDPHEQDQISEILSSLDDKIELNWKMNETLEETGRLLFRHWFINFEFPWDFEKNEFSWEGKPYKSSGGEMIESELGEIPKGWRIGGVLDIINKLSVPYKCDKKDLDDNGSTPIIDQGADGLYGYTKREADFFASEDEPVVLFTNHTCNFWYINYPFCAIQNVIPMRGKDGYDTEFLYFITHKSISFSEYKGHWPEFETKKFVIPTQNIAKEFSSVAKILLKQISKNRDENLILNKTRDLLLPRLMSGKLRIPIKK